MYAYHEILEDVLEHGERRSTRSGDVIGLFDHKFEWDMRIGFPALTTKKLMFRAMIGELLWFMNGEHSLHDLRRRSCIERGKWTIWTNDAERWGGVGNADCGDIYGNQWRNWNNTGFDQLQSLIDKMQNDHTSRYMIVQAFNPEVNYHNRCCLPACHTGFTVYVSADRQHFDLKWKQRSVDTFLGLPFNIASYGALMVILGQITGMTPRHLIGDLDDVHIYENHLEQANTLKHREPYDLSQCRLIVPPYIKSLDDLRNLTAADFWLENYFHHEELSAPLSVG